MLQETSPRLGSKNQPGAKRLEIATTILNVGRILKASTHILRDIRKPSTATFDKSAAFVCMHCPAPDPKLSPGQSRRAVIDIGAIGKSHRGDGGFGG
jgi:hypothetical protein